MLPVAECGHGRRERREDVLGADPLNREAKEVLDDLVIGIVSEKAATEVFGVVINGDAIDTAGTDAKRKALRKERLTLRTAK